MPLWVLVSRVGHPEKHFRQLYPRPRLSRRPPQRLQQLHHHNQGGRPVQGEGADKKNPKTLEKEKPFLDKHIPEMVKTCFLSQETNASGNFSYESASGTGNGKRDSFSYDGSQSLDGSQSSVTSLETAMRPNLGEVARRMREQLLGLNQGGLLKNLAIRNFIFIKKKIKIKKVAKWTIPGRTSNSSSWTTPRRPRAATATTPTWRETRSETAAGRDGNPRFFITTFLFYYF